MLCLPYFAVVLPICGLALGAPPTPSSLLSSHVANANFSLPLETTVPTPANPLPPSKETSYHIPGENVVVTFFDYSEIISPTDTSACMQQAIAECLKSFSSWNLPIAEVVKAYMSGSVRLSLYPRTKMRWRDWIIGVKGLEWFLANYPPVGMLFEVKVTGYGVVGYGAFTSIESNAITNATTNATTPMTAPSPNVPKLPPDPYRYSNRKDFQVVFKHYQHQISVVDVRNCAEHAVHDAYTKSQGAVKTVWRLTYYTFDGIYLIVIPVRDLMWRDWLYAAEAIGAFTAQWDTVALEFDILLKGKKVGAGILSDFEGVKALGLTGALVSNTESA